MGSQRAARRIRAWACSVALAAGVSAVLPLPARAWTRAQVETATAEVELQASGQAHVTLELGIRVQGGWLSQFELAGLEPDLTLDSEQPSVLRSDDGRTLAPIVKTRGEGRVVFSFPDKKTAAHRGLHQLRFAYLTTLGLSEGKRPNTLALSWSLPAWQADLRQADVAIKAPRGTRFAPDAESDVSLERELADEGEHTILRIHRGRLPRTLLLSAELELPATAADIASRPRNAVAHRAGLYVAALVLLLTWLKRRAALATAAQRGAQPVPFIGVGARTRGCAMLACAVFGGVCYDARPYVALGLLAAVVTLGLDRGFAHPGEQTRTSAARALALFATAAWMDATTPLGFSLLGAAYALAVQRLALGAPAGLWLEALLLVTPLWLTATRLHPLLLPAATAAIDPETASVSADADPRALDRAA